MPSRGSNPSARLSRAYIVRVRSRNWRPAVFSLEWLCDGGQVPADSPSLVASFFGFPFLMRILERGGGHSSRIGRPSHGKTFLQHEYRPSPSKKDTISSLYTPQDTQVTCDSMGFNAAFNSDLKLRNTSAFLLDIASLKMLTKRSNVCTMVF